MGVIFSQITVILFLLALINVEREREIACALLTIAAFTVIGIAIGWGIWA